MGRAESGVQSYCLDRLQALENQGKCYFFRNNSFTGHLTRYNGSTGYVKNGKPGMPDIVACFLRYPQPNSDHYQYQVLMGDIIVDPIGQFVGFEIKSATGRQSPEQKKAQAQIEAVGGSYYLISSPEQFEEALKSLL